MIQLNFKFISETGTKEKYLRSDHYNTIKTWWARRPITAARNLIIREILLRNGVQDFQVDLELASSLNPAKEKFKKFNSEFSTYNISLLDVFAGGGSIPFESARLGLKTYSAELNPIASLLQETIFNSQAINDFPRFLNEAGKRVIDNTERRIGKFFTINGVSPYVIFWSKVAKCKKCGGALDLRRLEYLCKKPSKSIRIKENKGKLEFNQSSDKDSGLQKEFVCSTCSTKHSFNDIKTYCSTEKLSYSAFAICDTSEKRVYKLLDENDKELLAKYDKLIDLELQKLSGLIPDGSVEKKAGVINPTIYELKSHRDFFSPRQLLVLLTVMDEIILEYKNLIQIVDESTSKQIVLGLTSLLEFLIDWNSLSTMWIPQNEQTGRSLAGPGVQMKWDFIEVNPFSKSGSNLRSKIDRVTSTLNAINFDNQINIIRGSSTELPLQDNSIDIVFTDPPYYDSIDYTGLSEFFRPWFEVLIRKTFDPNVNLKNQDEYEAIVELTSNSEKNKDHQHYEKIMKNVLSEVNRVLKSNGSVLLMYSHKTIEGWQVIAEAFQKSHLFISECIALEMERKARPRAMAYEALNGVITFRAVKERETITSTFEDIKAIPKKIKVGELLESQVVIYLAALACKEVCLSGRDFNSCYEELIKEYQILQLEGWLKEEMDSLTVAYLEGRIENTFEKIDVKYKQLLTEHYLIRNSKLLTFEELSINSLKESLLKDALLIYREFTYNSKTRVDIPENKRESLLFIFSILAGTQLNSVSKRSSAIEVKTARLILSKVQSSEPSKEPEVFSESLLLV